MVLAWLEAGEEAVVKPKAGKRRLATSKDPVVDWSQSAAFRNRSDERVLSPEETNELYESFKRDY